MGPLKAPGEDGYPACFFQKNWEVVGDEVMNFLSSVWFNPERISLVNNTLLTLIPKIDRPEFISQFRTIALCNVIYKMLTKALLIELSL